MKERRTFVAIMRAAAHGKGILLSPDEAFEFAAYPFIEQVAMSELTEVETWAVRAGNAPWPNGWLTARTRAYE